MKFSIREEAVTTTVTAVTCSAGGVEVEVSQRGNGFWYGWTDDGLVSEPLATKRLAIEWAKAQLRVAVGGRTG